MSRYVHQVQRDVYFKKVAPVALAPAHLKGAAGEMVVAADLLNRGLEVFRAVSPNSSVDLVAIMADVMYRVEVKTVQVMPNGIIKFNRPSPIFREKYDILALVRLDKSIAYLHRDDDGAVPWDKPPLNKGGLADCWRAT